MSVNLILASESGQVPFRHLGQTAGQIYRYAKAEATTRAELEAVLRVKQTALCATASAFVCTDACQPTLPV